MNFYAIEKTIDVVLRIGTESETIRIEAVREKSGKYSTQSYIRESVKVQSAFGDETKEKTIWPAYDLPWTKGDSADAVLKRALGFLKERSPKNSN